MKSLGKTVTVLTLLAIAVTVVLFYSQTGILTALEAKTYDFRMRTFSGEKITTGLIAVIEIDDRSLAEMGRFPWPRKYYADFLNKASAGGAKAVLFDIFFPEAESPEADGEFAAAMKRFGKVTLPVAFEFTPDGETTGIVESIPVLKNSAKSSAHINISPDSDGVIRWSRLLIKHGGIYYPSLGLSAALYATDAKTYERGAFHIEIGDASVPTDGEYRYPVNYVGPLSLFERHSFTDIINDRIKPDSLKGKVLLVGPTALGIYDMRVTPYSNNSSGIEVNANIADNIIRGDFMKRGGAEALIDLLGIAFIGIVVSVLATNLRALTAFPFVALVMGAYMLSVCLIFQRGIWLSIVYPTISGLLCYSGCSYFRFVLLDRKALEIRSMFSSYVSKKIVDRMVKDPGLARIGGESKVLTIMFADIKNYTVYSEKRTPAEVVMILNEYLSAMTDVIMEHDGTLDKFLGDGILAFWGAPVSQPEHAESAVRCSLKMLERLRQLHAKWEAEGREPLSCGIGINTGEVIVGNVGAEGKKMEYTVIGDNVNLTYRIQNEGRELNMPVMTRSAYELVKDKVIAEYAGAVLVKGKEKPVEIFALKGIKEVSPAP